MADPLLTLTVSAGFSAAHRLHSEERDEEWNHRVYGPCCRPNGHGHDYQLEVSVSGEVERRSGWFLDARELLRIVERDVVEPCHERHLNRDVPFLAGINPTAENLVVAFAERLAPRIPAGRLESVVLHETPKNRAIWCRSDDS